jgi:TetR/AcrR family transcriptional repressor of nem operon
MMMTIIRGFGADDDRHRSCRTARTGLPFPPMRLKKGEAERNRQEILDVAEKLFRERGFDGVGVADLMKAAGFTHGGFYNHFTSKDQLAGQATAAAFARSNAALAESLQKGGAGGWKAYVRQYLSPRHRDDPAQGCTLAALAPDAARKGPEMQARFADALEEIVGIVAADLARKDNRGDRPSALRERALQMLSEMIGALVLSRAVAAADPGLSAEILAANRRKLDG